MAGVNHKNQGQQQDSDRQKITATKGIEEGEGPRNETNTGVKKKSFNTLYKNKRLSILSRSNATGDNILTAYLELGLLVIVANNELNIPKTNSQKTCI